MRISEAFAEYRRVEVMGRGCSLKTDEGFRCSEVAVEKFFGDVNIRSLKLTQISDFYLDLVEPGEDSKRERAVTKNTARGYVMALRCVIRYCRKRGIKTVNPDEIVLPKREKKFANFIDEKQYDQLYEEISRPKRGYAKINRMRNALIVKMLFFTGLRVGELCALNRDSIRDRQFTVVGKSKLPRPCFITIGLEADIEAYLAARHDNEIALFISNETGKRMTPANVQSIFRRATKAVGMTKVTPHTMRHSFATRMIDNNVDIRYVADLLGHQDLSTTQCYTHVRNYKLREIYNNALETS